MKKKILFLSNHFITLYNFRKELLEEIVKTNDVYISTPPNTDNVFFENMGCKVIETNVERRKMNPFKDTFLIIEYLKIINKIKPDVIFSYTIKPNIYGSIAANLLKVRQINNITGTGATFIEENFKSKIVKILYRLSIKHSYKVFFQNKGDMEYFVNEKLVNNNFELIPGSGVNLKEFKFMELPKNENLNFIFIGRIMKVKGIEEFLYSAKKIKETFPNITFYVAGFLEEKEYENIINEYHSDGIINYIGFQKNIRSWIEKSHCTVLPSHGGEGVPNVLLESSAMGRPCIASNINGSNEVVKHGENGYLFKCKDGESLKNEILKFISLKDSEKRLMGLKGRELMNDKFNREIIINKYINEINSK